MLCSVICNKKPHWKLNWEFSNVHTHKYTDLAWVEKETQEINNDPAVKKKVSGAMRTVAVLKKS